jgi:hypothetical protein
MPAELPGPPETEAARLSRACPLLSAAATGRLSSVADSESSGPRASTQCKISLETDVLRLGFIAVTKEFDLEIIKQALGPCCRGRGRNHHVHQWPRRAPAQARGPRAVGAPKTQSTRKTFTSESFHTLTRPNAAY